PDLERQINGEWLDTTIAVALPCLAEVRWFMMHSATLHASQITRPLLLPKKLHPDIYTLNLYFIGIAEDERE
ncbi:MAG: hypothetical protein U9R27_11565, partial [Campylobacterota bacterium]|nr:hypothetical protein [Campylobacterota bacterium]